MLVVDDASVPDDAQKPWRAGEVWTKRRIYGLDATFTCVEVLDRESGRLDLTHDMIGARLGGGRLRHNDTVRFSYPLPLPGMEAMFVKGTKQGFTSPLERMVVRIRMVHMSEGRAIPSWEAIVDRDSLKA